jgi:enoyl-CoA hydratase/carnithine racemase
VSLIEVEQHGAVALLRLNRPEKLNALSTALERELDAALDDARVRSAGAIVIAGNERAFSAGADMSEIGEAGAADALAYYRDTGGVYERIARLPQPSIAAIRGWCLGGGFELALACDFRIADSGATFGLPEVEIGIIPSSGGTVRLVKAIGALRAKELILLRRRLPTAQVAELGLVTEVVNGDPEARALAVAAELAELPALAVELAKKAADGAEDSSRDAALLIEQLAYAALAEAGGTRPQGSP